MALDGLRGIAALMVFAQHVHLPGEVPYKAGLHTGVLIFFALSGYLLYAPFVRGRVNLRTYALRRFLRIVPAYLVASVLIGAIWYPDVLADPIGILTMQHTTIEVVWTLRLEVAFYVLLPFVAYGLGRLPESRRVPALVFGGVASVLWTVALMVVIPRMGGSLTMDSIGSILSYAWAFVPGMLAAQLRPRIGRWTLLGGLSLLGVASVIDMPDVLALPAGIGAGLLIAWVAERPVPASLVRPCIFAGAVSYSVYLWHLAIIFAVDRPYSWLGTVLALVLTVAVASLVYILVERPAIELGRRPDEAVARLRHVGRGVALVASSLRRAA